MTYEQRHAGIIDSLEFAAGKGLEVVKTTLQHYRDSFVDEGRHVDTVIAENRRLKAIVDMIELKQRIDLLESAVPGMRVLVELFTRDDPQTGFVCEAIPSHEVGWRRSEYVEAFRTFRKVLHMQTEPEGER